MPNYWIVDPSAATVTCYTLADEGDYQRIAELGARDELASPLFPDITIPVSELVNR